MAIRILLIVRVAIHSSYARGPLDTLNSVSEGLIGADAIVDSGTVSTTDVRIS